MEGKMKYESPKLTFRALTLSEHIADQCWGLAYAWYDFDKDGSIDGGEKVDLSTLGLGTSGCQGSAAQDALISYFYSTFGVTLSSDDVKVNTKSQVVIGSNS